MNVFLTGSTGFVGGELAVLLSQTPNIERIYCLVRAKDKAEASNRLQQVFEFHGDIFDATKVIPVIGDLTDGELAEKLRALPELQEVQTVIHAAADTSFGPACAENVEKVNIGGTLQILCWAQTLPRLETFLYVGTASICGTNLVDCNIHEDQSPNAQASHLVRYCFTKMAGEIQVNRMIPPEKLLIVRPSIIMGDARQWTPRSYVILWALAAVNTVRLIPANPQAKLDIIPVDYVARAILELLFAKRRWTTYHISAGPQSATSLEKVVRAIDDPAEGRPQFQFVKRELLRQMKKWPKKLQPWSELFRYDEYLAYWNSVFNGNGGLRLVLSGMEPYFRFIELSQTFDNSRLLADTSVGNPSPAHEYLQRTRRFLNEINVTEGALDP